MNRTVIPFPGKWEGKEPPPSTPEYFSVSFHPQGDIKFLNYFKNSIKDINIEKIYSIPYVDLRQQMNDDTNTKEINFTLCASYIASLEQYFARFGEGKILMRQYNIIDDEWKSGFIVRESDAENNVEALIQILNLWTVLIYVNKHHDILCIAGFFGVDHYTEGGDRRMKARRAISWFEDAKNTAIENLPIFDYDWLMLLIEDHLIQMNNQSLEQ